jgi:[protein-PII] uridylyltransferase
LFPIRLGSIGNTQIFNITPRVLIDNNASNSHTVIEINGLDRPGLLYEVTDTITNNELQISSAKISTYGEQVVDVFYVKDYFGMKIEHPVRLKYLRDALLITLKGAVVAA